MTSAKDNKKYWGYFILATSLLIFFATFSLRFFAPGSNSINSGLKQLEKNLHFQESEANLIIKDTLLLKKLANAAESLNELNTLYEKPYGVFLYKKFFDSSYLRFWNTDLVQIPDSILKNEKEEQFALLSNGYYLIKRKSYQQDKSLNLYFVFLIKSHFFITDKNFTESFPLNSRLDGLVEISKEESSSFIKSLSGKAEIYFKEKPSQKLGNESQAMVWMRVISFIFSFIALFIILRTLYSGNDKKVQLLFFIGTLVLFRIALYALKKILNLDSLELFDPQVYASNSLLPSLGDLLINCVLFCWAGLFIWKRFQIFESHEQQIIGSKMQVFWNVGCVVLLVLLTLGTVSVIRGLIANSKISFDVTNFFSLNVYTAVGFFSLAFLCMGFYYYSRILYQYLFHFFSRRTYWIYLLITLLGLLTIAFFVADGLKNLYLLTVLWLLLYTALVNLESGLNLKSRFNVSGIVIWIFIFSISIAAILLFEINKVELRQRRVYIQKLDTQTDPATERLINIGNTYLDSNFFSKNLYRFYDEVQNKLVRDSILSNNYSRYLETYSASLYIYDSLNKPLFNRDSLSFETINAIVFQQANPTDLPNLFYFESDYDKFAYITYRKILGKNGNNLGTVFIISKPKKFTSASLNIQLFRQAKDWEFSNSLVYNYAIYSNRLLVASSKKYPFTSTIENNQLPQFRFEIRQREGYSELWYRPNKNKVIVMTRKNEQWIQAITLFSYIFCSLLFLMAFVQLLTVGFNFIFYDRLLNGQFKVAATIRSQIHSTFIVITVLSFIIIAIATISLFTKSFKDANAERLGRTMTIMLNEMQSHKELSTLIFEQRTHRDSNRTKELQEIIKRVADIHGLDANIYDYSGKLLATSQPYMYENGFLSSLIDPKAYYYLLELRHIEHTQVEKVSELEYTSMYAPIRNSNGAFSAYLSIPYFTSQQELNDEISRFLITLINLNAFIFLITGLVAFLIANRITRSFGLIKDKMMRMNLSQENEMIVWDRNDEIGGLVTEYNKMVSKLQSSADAIAKTERIEAWREMARQVAHEIKNPLTPMKLSLQYLQRAVDSNHPKVEQLAANVSKTLVEQIDHLSKIAADFSQFANINQSKKEVFNLHEVLKSLIAIYQQNPDIELQWKPATDPVNILADKTQMNRVFNNLFSNAFEARKENQKCRLLIKENLEDGNVLIAVEDNGLGIDEEMRKKIFTPNFTTKSSGAGLGLAMCKSIVEYSGGEIYFETLANKGTTFFISLPLVN